MINESNNEFIKKVYEMAENASDIKPDDPWMRENEWDEIFKQSTIANDILNIPYIDSDNMDEYLNNLAERVMNLEQDSMKRALNSIYGIRNLNNPIKVDTEALIKTRLNRDLEDMIKAQKPLSKDVKVTDIPGGIEITANKIPEEIHTNVTRIITEVEEDVDNFIFTTMKPWCEERVQRKVSKTDLEQALLMYYSLDNSQKTESIDDTMRNVRETGHI